MSKGKAIGSGTLLLLVLLIGAGVLAALAQTSEKRPTELYVRTSPPGAKVLLDGKEVGTSPGLFEVKPGAHAVVVKLAGHESKTKNVTIRDGRIKRVILDLQKGPEAGPTKAIGATPAGAAKTRRSATESAEKPETEWGNAGDTGKPKWSKPVNGLVGRVVIPRVTITPSEHFDVSVELKNVGASSLGVQTGNPHAFHVQVRDAKGRPVRPTSERTEVSCNPQWVLLRQEARLRFQATSTDANRSKGSDLDIVTQIWCLEPGKYELFATYSSKDFPTAPGQRKPENPWEGELALPPVEVEVAGIAAIARSEANPALRRVSLQLLDAESKPVDYAALIPASVGYRKDLPPAAYWPQESGWVKVPKMIPGRHLFMAHIRSPNATLFEVQVPQEQRQTTLKLRPWTSSRALSVNVNKLVDEGSEVLEVTISNKTSKPYTLDPNDLRITNPDFHVFPSEAQQHRELVIPPRGQGSKTVRLNWEDYVRHGIWCARGIDSPFLIPAPPKQQVYVSVEVGITSSLAVPVTQPEVVMARPEAEGERRESLSWGPALEGVQCRVRAEKPAWPQGTVPKLLVDLRNQGQRNLRVALEHESWEIEIDGKWHQPDSGMTGRRHYLPLPPGGQQQNLEVWISDGDNLGRHLRALQPGRHTLRVARLLNSSRAPGEEILRLVSNPIEIEVVPVEPGDEAEKTAWGPAVEGVQIRLWAEKKTWRVDEEVILRVDCRNQGKRDLMLDDRTGCFDVYVGHRSYSPDPNTTNLSFPAPFGPGRHYKGRPVALGRYPGLELAPGKYTIRVVLKADQNTVVHLEGARAGTEKRTGELAALAQEIEKRRSQPPVIVSSNPIEIEIVPAEAHTRKVHLPDFDPSGERVVLDLASGDLLLEPASGNPPEITQFSYVDVGDLFYDGVLGCKRGRTVMRWDGNRFVPLPVHQRRLDATVHRLPKLPCRLLMTTFQKRHFDVSVLAVTADGGLQLEYRPADPSLVPKSAPEQARRVHLPDADTPGAEVVLDLASGETLKAAPNGKEALAEFTRLGKGDLFYNRALGCLRGATAMRWDGQRFVPLPGKRPNQIPLPGTRLDQLEDKYKLLVYQLPETPWIPCRLLITTAERKHFDLTVLSVTEKGGIVLEYRPARPAAEEEKTAWGPGVEGVQCRIRAEKPTWHQGTVPKLLADLRNQGKRNLRIALEHESWEIEIDGKWHEMVGGFTGDRNYLPLAPGGQQQDLEVWILADGSLSRKLRALEPGKHTLRVARLFHEGTFEERLRVVSNPIEIEIVPADAAAPQSAAAQPPATAATGETYLPGEKGRVYPSAEQRDAVTALEQLGALVMRDADGRAKTVDLKGTQATNAELVHLKGLASLRSLDLFGINISDAGLVHLTGLTELETLQLGGTPITDAGLRHLRGLTKLKTLNLCDTKVTDAGLEHLKGLTELEGLTLPSKITDAGLVHLGGLTELSSLSLSFTQVTDAGLAQLKGLSQIEDLGLRSTKVSDAGLVHLKDLPQLERLRLNDTQVTVEGVKQLKQARPKLQIFHNEHPGPGQPGFAGAQAAAGIEDVQVRLRADKRVWQAGEIPTFKVDVRNGAKDKLYDTFGRRVIHHLEFDGRWYCNSDRVRKRQLEISPGEELNRLGISLRPEDWHREGTPNTPQLTPGKHVVCVAFVGTLGAGSERDGGKPVRAVSNPVEIEILPDKPGPERTGVKPDQKDAAVAPQEPGPRSQRDAQGDTSSPVDEAIEIIERHSLTGVDRGELSTAAIRGMIGKFDPDSAYLGVEQVARANRELGQDLAGVGLELRFAENARLLTVVGVLPGMPAHKAGVRPGDTITAIDAKRIEDLPQGKELETAVKLLRGKPGDEVVLHVRHVGPKTVHAIRITRAIIEVPTVRGDTRGPDYRWNFMLDDEQKIGYVRLTRFGARSAEELQNALNELKSQGMKGLIVDLRNNPGGSLSQAIRIADLFVDCGIIVSVHGRDQPGQVWSAKKEGTFGGFPMAVLVNGNSAGASEIVAACLQDHKRAIVVGERTYGRGITQGVFGLEGGKNALRLTTATFLRPTGKNLHRAADAEPSDDWGVAPDPAYEVKLSAEELKQYDRYRQARDAFSVGGSPASDFKDRPLQKSLDYIRALHR